MPGCHPAQDPAACLDIVSAEGGVSSGQGLGGATAPPHTSFFPFAAGFYLSYLFRTIGALIAGQLSTEFELTPASLGLMTSAYFLTFAVAQLPVGVALDRYGPRLVQSVLLLIAAGGAVLFAASPGFGPLIVGRALIGVGVAGALAAGLKAAVLWFPKERLSLVNGAMVTVGALGAVTATTPSEWLLASIGWRGVFEMLSVVTAGSAVLIYLVVPEEPLPKANAHNRPFAGLRTIFKDRRFWRLAPLAATSIGTAWSLQGLWAALWLSDVERLDRTTLVNYLLAMALTLSLGALFLGAVADRLRSRGFAPHIPFATLAALFIVVQFALILRWPLPSSVLWCVVAVIGGGTIFSYAAVAELFPKDLAGRANAALNVFHIGGAFVLQNLTGIIVQRWPIQNGHHPTVAYQTAFTINVLLQVAAWTWFMCPSLKANARAISSLRSKLVAVIWTQIAPKIRSQMTAGQGSPFAP